VQSVWNSHAIRHRGSMAQLIYEWVFADAGVTHDVLEGNNKSLSLEEG